jgi:hypothetical protein
MLVATIQEEAVFDERGVSQIEIWTLANAVCAVAVEFEMSEEIVCAASRAGRKPEVGERK